MAVFEEAWNSACNSRTLVELKRESTWEFKIKKNPFSAFQLSLICSLIGSIKRQQKNKLPKDPSSHNILLVSQFRFDCLFTQNYEPPCVWSNPMRDKRATCIQIPSASFGYYEYNSASKRRGFPFISASNRLSICPSVIIADNSDATDRINRKSERGNRWRFARSVTPSGRMKGQQVVPLSSVIIEGMIF